LVADLDLYVGPASELLLAADREWQKPGPTMLPSE
jgi:hypothetical protein